MNKIYLITGGNIGDRKKQLEQASTLISKQVGAIKKKSMVYQTEAWGLTDQPEFYNQVLLVESRLRPEEVIASVLDIEEKMGRKRTIKNAARIIDIDILFYNNEIIHTPSLTIPHPEIAHRRFVLAPLSEIAPELIHPLLKKSIRDLLSACRDILKVTPLKP